MSNIEISLDKAIVTTLDVLAAVTSCPPDLAKQIGDLLALRLPEPLLSNAVNQLLHGRELLLVQAQTLFVLARSRHGDLVYMAPELRRDLPPCCAVPAANIPNDASGSEPQ